ncbi:hypothetical protein HELRODRAFT_164008 [Helobdella robusta]|uniref:Uncharacterized protein n=1 Tax=Helobdella robusta TaxID=6412 RepID=T1EUR4_HELRO|nr:hypothetical protein HELRODRAFT_164008 [Helobdella robusta]ESN94211.1 hypothetical protein HELRODRAFT_164008 [Helobdella robusta]
MGPRGCIALVSCAAINPGKCPPDTGSVPKVQLLASSLLLMGNANSRRGESEFLALNQMTRASAVAVFSSRLGDCLCHWVETAATKFFEPKAFATSFLVKIFLRLFGALLPVTVDLLKICDEGYIVDRGMFQNILRKL